MKNVHLIPTDKPTWLHKSTLTGVLRKSSSCIDDMKQAQGMNIYITSDEEIKDGDWVISIEGIWKNTITKIIGVPITDVWKKIILTTDQDLIKDDVQAIDDKFLEWFVKNPSCESVEVDKTIPRNFDGLDSVRQDKFLELFYKSELFDEIKYNDAFDWSVNEGKDYLKLFQSYKIIIPKEEPKQNLEKEMFELEQELDIPSHLRWHNSKPKQETLEEAARNYRDLKLPDDLYDGFIAGAKWQQERMYSEEEVIKILLARNADLGIIGKTSAVVEFIKQFKKK